VSANDHESGWENEEQDRVSDPAAHDPEKLCDFSDQIMRGDQMKSRIA